MQWENNVMGPDDKQAELAKIAKAPGDREGRRREGRRREGRRREEPSQGRAKRTPAAKTAAPVLLATPEDENAGQVDQVQGKSSARIARSRRSSPPPRLPRRRPRPSRPTTSSSTSCSRASPRKRPFKSVDDSELNDLLAKDKVAAAPKPRGKRADSVDDLLKQAEQLDVAVTKAKTPEWAKIEAPTAPPPPIVVPRAQPKKDDGVIHVVQGAAGGSKNPRPQMAAAPSRRSQNADTFDRRDATERREATSDRRSAEAADRRGGDAADPFDAPRGRRNATTSSRPASFSDPFADSAPAPRTRVAPPPPPPRTAPAPRAMPAARREPAAAPAFRDPFGDSPPPSKTVKRTPETKPAGRSGGFKDPFSEASRPRTTRAPWSRSGRATPSDRAARTRPATGRR